MSGVKHANLLSSSCTLIWCLLGINTKQIKIGTIRYKMLDISIYLQRCIPADNSRATSNLKWIGRRIGHHPAGLIVHNGWSPHVLVEVGDILLQVTID